jgi:hypothetical protein
MEAGCMTRILRCAACTKRIKPHHPHVGLIDLGASPGREICYHARPECHERGAAQIAAMMERGKAYVLRHYHSSNCPDERPGWDCAAGCFSEAPEAVAN